MYCYKTEGCVTEYSVYRSRAWTRSRLGRVTPETATYASLWRAFLKNQSQPQNLLSKSLYLLCDT
jgi:hypothetical protein